MNAMAMNNKTPPIFPKTSIANNIAKINPAITAQYTIRILTAVCSKIPLQKPCLAIDVERERKNNTQ